MTVKTIREVSELSGISLSALRYYDEVGLFGEKLPLNDRGQRVFDKDAIARLQQILFFRELRLGISEIKTIFTSSGDVPSSEILNQQIIRLRAEAQRYANLALLAEIARDYGIRILDFHLSEEEIRKILDTYRKAADADIERINNMSQSDKVMLLTGLFQFLQNLGELWYSDDPNSRADGMKQIEQFSSLLCSVLDIDAVPLRSMAKGITGGGTVTELLDQSEGPGFSDYLAELLIEYADLHSLPDADGEDYLDLLYHMWA